MKSMENYSLGPIDRFGFIVYFNNAIICKKMRGIISGVVVETVLALSLLSGHIIIPY